MTSSDTTMSTLADRVPRGDGTNCFQLQYLGIQVRDASWHLRTKTKTYGVRLCGIIGALLTVS